MQDRVVQGILERFPGRRVLVVGDVMLDEYLFGTVRRISPEAPVPVVELQRQNHVPGGAANAAANVAALRGDPVLVSVVGGDEAGRRLKEALAERGINTSALLVDEGRPTTTKTRIIAHSQQVVRVDHEERSPLSEALEERLLDLIDDRLGSADVCILSDYAKGLVSHTLARRLIRRAAEMGKPVVVDPKGADPATYRGATLVKPNLHEAGLLLGREVSTADDMVVAGRRLVELLGAAVLITRGAAGMSLFEPDAAPTHIPTQAREVYDVTGAGDTVAATLAVALAAGAGVERAARLASRAAGITVGRLGTTAVRLDELADGCGEHRCSQ